MSPLERQIDFWGKVFAACAMAVAFWLGFGWLGPNIPLPF